MINSLLVRWARGWHEVTDAASIAANGRHEGTLALGAVDSLAEVERVAHGQLAAVVRESIEVDLAPTGPADTPYQAFAVADTVSVPALAGGDAVERVVTLTVAEDENGLISWVPELRDVILTAQERYEQAIAKMANGSLAGTSAAASPMPQIPTPQPIPGQGGGGTVVAAGWEMVWSVPGLVWVQRSAVWTTPMSGTLAGLVATFGTPPSGGTHTVSLWANGASVWSGNVPAATNPWAAPSLPPASSSADTTRWQVRCDSVGSGSPADMSVAVRFA